MRILTSAGWPILLMGTALGLGLVGLVSALSSDMSSRTIDGASAEPPPPGRSRMRTGGTDVATLGVGLVVGLICMVVTGWPAAGPIGALAAVGLPRLLRKTSGAVSIATIEAVATWTEMLQGTLAASAGLGQAIIATAELSPDPIRPATEHLASQIRSGVHPREALLQFAEHVGDPCADRVVCSLLLAFSSRAQRLGELLQALAESTREEASLRLRIETSRASVRSGVRTVVVFSVVFAVGLSVLAHPYLVPFGSPTGQLVLCAVGGLYAAGLTLMVTLARPPEAIRLLGDAVVLR